MVHVALNSTAIESLTARRRIGLDPLQRSELPPISRRNFIKALVAGVVALSCSPLYALSLSSSRTSAQLCVNGTQIWSLDVGWLAGAPLLQVVEYRGKTVLSLSGARYPGTDVSADFEALFDLCSDTPTMLLRHALDPRAVEVALFAWLAGDKTVVFEDRSHVFTGGVGAFLHLQQLTHAQVVFSPSLTLAATAPGGWRLGGAEFWGLVDSLVLSRPAEPALLNSQSPLLRSQMLINAGAGHAHIAPQMEAQQRSGYSVGTVQMASLRLEQAEDADGARHHAFLAEGLGVAVVRRDGVAGAESQGARVLARDPAYARSLTADGATSALWLGAQGQAVTPFGSSVLVSRPADPGEPLRLQSGASGFAVSCYAHPYTVAVASDANVSVTIRFPAGPQVPGGTIAKICPFTFTHKEIALEGAEITFKRPENALFLRFRLDGFRLVRNWRGISLRASEGCRLTVLTGAQSVLEEVFFVPPHQYSDTAEPPESVFDRYLENERKKYLLSGKSAAGWAAEQALLTTAWKRPVDPVKPEYEATNSFASQAVVSGGSQLVYRLAPERSVTAQARLESLSLSLGSLLDAELWKLVVVQDATSDEIRRKAIVGSPVQASKSVPPADATYLELPTSLYVSPDESGRFRPSGLATPLPGQHHDIFRLVGDAGQTRSGMPLRAIASRGFTLNTLPGHFDPAHADDPDPIGFRTSLDMRDRSELVWLTSQWDQPALLGTRDVRTDNGGTHELGVGIYVPQPFYAGALLLSSMGGTLKSLGRWDPPSLTRAGFALSVERWEHRETFGKLSSDALVYKGFLLPFGIRASLLKVPERREAKLPELGVLSLPMQKFFIEISDPQVQYSESLAPYAGRTWPFLKIELELRGRLQIDDPTLSGLCGFGQSAFKICVERGHGYLFGFEIDGDPNRKGTAMLAFVENTIAHDLTAMTSVTGAFNRSAQATWGQKQLACAPLGQNELSQYDMNLLNAKVRYAPPRKSDDTSYVTTRMGVRLGLHDNLVNSAVIEASGKPPTYPEMQSASIVIPALNRLTGQDPQMPTEVVIAPLFRQVGFDAPGAATISNESEVFLSLQTPVAMSFSGKGERAGAVGTPNMNAHYLSRSAGLMGQTAQVLHTPPNSRGVSLLASGASSKVSFSGADLFSPDAKLLGVLKLADLCEVLDLKEVPRFIESARHQVDAAGEDIGVKICQFVSTSKPVLADVLRDLATELAKYKSLLPLQEHLQEFGSAIDAIPCTDKLEVAIAVEQIAVAGGALEKARRFVENLMQNPALLLPTDITSFITKWLKLVADLELAYRDLRDGVEQQLALLKAEIIVAVQEIESEAGAAVSAQLNRVCAELVDNLARLVTLVLPPDQQVEQLLALYHRFQKVYLDVLGLYRELSYYWEVCESSLAVVARDCVLVAASAANSFISQLCRAIEAPLHKLDKELRSWPESEYEEARAFFRRVEPSVDELTAAYLALSTYGASNFTAVVGHLERLWHALTEIDQVIDQPRTTKLRLSGGATAYLNVVRDEVANVRTILADMFRKLGLLSVSVAGSGQREVNQILQDLVSQLGASVRAISAVLNGATQMWQNVSISDNEVIGRGIELVKLCVVVQGRLQHIATPLPKPPLYVLCPPSINALHARITAVLRVIDEKLRAWLLALVPTVDPDWLKTASEFQYLLGPAAVLRLKELVIALDKGRDKLVTDSAKLDNIGGQGFDDVIKTIEEIQLRWRELAAEIKRIGEAPDRHVIMLIEGKLRDMASQLIPAEIKLDFEFETTIKKSVAIFRPGTTSKPGEAKLKLGAHIRHNVLSGASSSDFTGVLSSFRLNLYDLLIISFREVRFESKSGSGPKLYPPTIENVGFDGCLSVVDGLKAFFEGGNGPYVLPVPNGMRAGYRINPGTVPLAGMIIQNLVIDAGIEIPFDDRAAITTFSVSTRASPALLFIAPYGGTMFFGLEMAGDRLVSIEAEFAAGLVAAFDLGAVKGDGRVTLGFYFKQSISGPLLSGFFFAGGSGNVLGIVSISVALRIALVYENSQVTGHGEFSVEIGCSPFEWSLNYSVDYAVSNAATKRRLLGADTVQGPKKHIYQAQIPLSLFLHEPTWRKFQAAYAKSGEVGCSI